MLEQTGRNGPIQFCNVLSIALQACVRSVYVQYNLLYWSSVYYWYAVSRFLQDEAHRHEKPQNASVHTECVIQLTPISQSYTSGNSATTISKVWTLRTAPKPRGVTLTANETTRNDNG